MTYSKLNVEPREDCTVRLTQNGNVIILNNDDLDFIVERTKSIWGYRPDVINFLKENYDYDSIIKNEPSVINVIKSKADLLSLNGSDAYGSIETEYRLMTFDEARKYMPILRNYIIQGTWWLATPCYVDNTTNNPVCCISNDLVIGFLSYHSYGVRPVCLLNSEIFVMDVKEENDVSKSKNDCRGKTLIGEKWVYGSLIDNAFYKKTDNPLSPIISIPYIFCPNKEFCSWDEIVEECDIFEVVPESVGRFTGFTDKNGVMIYEGDICEVNLFDACGSDYQYLCKVIFNCGSFIFLDIKDSSISIPFLEAPEVEIIGNTYDNPELL